MLVKWGNSEIGFPNFRSISFAKSSFRQRNVNENENFRSFSRKFSSKKNIAKFVLNFRENREIRSKFTRKSPNFRPFLQNHIFSLKYNLLDAKWKDSKMHWNSRKFWTKINEFRSFIFALSFNEIAMEMPGSQRDNWNLYMSTNVEDAVVFLGFKIFNSDSSCMF